MGAALTSDHVNYLIWRYLQEQGYGKAAIQLSREWKTTDPQTLPFAPSVKPYFLIQMLQDALAYDELVVTARQMQQDVFAEGDSPADSRDSRARQPPPLLDNERRYQFVDFKRSRNSYRPEDVSDIGDANAKRKQHRLDLPSERHKPSKPGSLNSLPPVNGDLMDVDDSNQQLDAMEDFPVNDEPLPLLHTLETGQSTGIQIEEKQEEDKTPKVTTFAVETIPGADIFGLQWDHASQARLLVNGGKAWHFLSVDSSRQEVAAEDVGPLAPPALLKVKAESQYDKHRPDQVSNFLVSQVAMTTEGGRCLCAQALEELHSDSLAAGSIALSVDNTADSIELEKPLSTVIALRFSPDARHLLAVWHASDDDTVDQAFVRVWDTEFYAAGRETVSEQLIYDATWTSASSFVLCGEKILDIFKKQDDGQFEFHSSIETDRVWEQVHFDTTVNQIACSSGNDGILGILDLANAQLATHVAHEDVITAVRWRPSPKTTRVAPDVDMDQPVNDASNGVDVPRLLATSSTDGSIRLWDIRSGITCLFTLSMPSNLSIWAIEFSPDGDRIAATSERQLVVWPVEREGSIVAQWTQPTLENRESGHTSKTNGDHPSHLSNGERYDSGRDEDGDAPMADETTSEDGLSPLYHLAWDPSGKRIARALHDTVSIVELPDS